MTLIRRPAVAMYLHYTLKQEFVHRKKSAVSQTLGKYGVISIERNNRRKSSIKNTPIKRQNTCTAPRILPKQSSFNINPFTLLATR